MLPDYPDIRGVPTFDYQRLSCTYGPTKQEKLRHDARNRLYDGGPTSTRPAYGKLSTRLRWHTSQTHQSEVCRLTTQRLHPQPLPTGRRLAKMCIRYTILYTCCNHHEANSHICEDAEARNAEDDMEAARRGIIRGLSSRYEACDVWRCIRDPDESLHRRQEFCGACRVYLRETLDRLVVLAEREGEGEGERESERHLIDGVNDGDIHEAPAISTGGSPHPDGLQGESLNSRRDKRAKRGGVTKLGRR